MNAQNDVLFPSTRATSGPRFELPIEPAGNIFDRTTWFGDVSLVMLAEVSNTDPRSITNDGIFNLTNQPGAVLFVSKDAFDSLPMAAKRYLFEVIYSGRVPFPQPVGDPPATHAEFKGVIEIDSRIDHQFFVAALSDWVQIKVIN
jgi:hypothetical protein